LEEINHKQHKLTVFYFFEKTSAKHMTYQYVQHIIKGCNHVTSSNSSIIDRLGVTIYKTK